ncbi:unnamed protein product [Jaminaea pallidilutea]
MADADDQDELFMGPSAGSSSTAVAGAAGQTDYRYLQEIAQMMFVFGRVIDPPEAVLKLVEDIVRHQVIQMTIQARSLSMLRHARTLAPEDFIFLVRYDRAKVNRLRTYLSWKEVRKNAKEDSGGGGAGEVDLNAAVEDVDMAKAQGSISRKVRVKLPWEVSHIYADYLIAGAGAGTGPSNTTVDGALLPPEVNGAAQRLQQPTADEELDDDDQEAMRDSLKRLKEADDATIRMTREEYEHYSECRAASFTFRKGKKFRDFISSSTYLDVRPNDDIVDVLGFLAFEVVRELTLGAKVAWEQEREVELWREAEIERERAETKKRRGSGDQNGENGEDGEDGTDGERTRSQGGQWSSSSEEHQRRRSRSSPAPRRLQNRDSRRHVSESPRKKKRRQQEESEAQRAGDDKDESSVDDSMEQEEVTSKATATTANGEPDLSSLYADPDEPNGFCGLFGGGGAGASSIEKATEGEEDLQGGDGAVTAAKSEASTGQSGTADKAGQSADAEVEADASKASSTEVKQGEAEGAKPGKEEGDAGREAGATTTSDEVKGDTDEGKANSEGQDGDAKPSEENAARDTDTSEERQQQQQQEAQNPESQQQQEEDKGQQEREEPKEQEEEEVTPALLPHHIREAFARLQRDKTRPALSSGVNVGGPIGGLRRTRVMVI